MKIIIFETFLFEEQREKVSQKQRQPFDTGMIKRLSAETKGFEGE